MIDLNGTLRRHDGRYSLGFEREFAHSPKRVWRALTDNDDLVYWFPATIEGERATGAKLRFVFTPPSQEALSDADAEAFVLDGEMRVFDPPKTLEYSWGDEVLRFELKPVGADSTRLVFTHIFDDEAKSARDASGWEFCFESLESRLAGREPDAFDTERFDGVFEDYARRFGPAASVKREPGA